MTIIEALRDPRMFGALPAFRDLRTWARWTVFCAALEGQPLDAAQTAIFRQHTGRSRYAPPVGGWREAVAIVGRQSGKTRIASVIADVAALSTSREPDGTALYSLLISQDQRAALRTLFAYASAPFGGLVPTLKRILTRRKADTLTLDNGAIVAAYPCRPDAVRGLRACCVVCDELAYFRNSEAFPTDREMVRAVRPTLATTGGRLVILSSPYGQSGALWELHRAHYGREDAPVLVWQASAPEMNPTLPADYLARMAQDDPEAYRSEVLGEFRAGIATFLDPDAIAACVESGVRERPPRPGPVYCAFADPSGGRHDAFTVAIAHRDGERAVLDVVRAWRPPFNPAGVIAEAADVVKEYRVTRVTGDRYAGEFPAEQFRANGIVYEPSERDRSAIYLALLPLVTSDRYRLTRV